MWNARLLSHAWAGRNVTANYVDFAAADLVPLVEAVDVILRSDPPSGHYMDIMEAQSS